MKNILKYGVLSIFTLLCMWSCENFLDETSSAQITADDQFSSTSGFKDALIGVYIGMTRPELYSKDLMYNMIDVMSRQYEPLTGNARYFQAQSYNYRGVLSTPQIDNLWIRTYNVIANVNSALDAIDINRGVLNPIDYSIIKGELLGLRAFLHFDLMRLYGLGNLENRPNGAGALAIPYSISFSKDVVARRAYEDTFNSMETDIENALELLKFDPIYTEVVRSSNFFAEVNRDGFYSKRSLRMNYYAVKALKARVFAWQGGLENMNIARLAAEEVIDKSFAMLIQGNNYPINLDPILYPEVLFALDVTAFENSTLGFLNAAIDVTNSNALFFSQINAASLYETNNVNIGLADIRFNTLLESQTRGLVSIKLVQKAGIINPEKVPLIKLPEMYYIASEYYIDANSLPNAIAYLNKVRRSRGIIQNIPDTATKLELENELFKEYRKEFVGEGQLFFYYKRNGLTTFPGLANTVVADDAIYVLPIPDTDI